MKKMFWILFVLVAIILIAPKSFHAEETEGYIFVGDSRTVGMQQAVEKDNTVFYVCKESQGYKWLVDTAEDEVAAIIKENTKIKKWNILVNLGINDLGNAEKYVDEYERLQTEDWKNYNLYYISVYPVNEEKTKITNEQIDEFNSYFSDSTNYISISETEKNKFNSSDGVHFDGDTYRWIYGKIFDNLSIRKNMFSGDKLKYIFKY
jgi:hypothetical protein